MKKIFTLCVVALMAVTTVKAQHEIGAVVGGLNGLSYKYWFSDNLALQADLAVGLTAAYAGAYYEGTKLGEGQFDMYDFTINPNVLYHFDLPANFKLYCGGGVNLGLMSYIENLLSFWPWISVRATVLDLPKLTILTPASLIGNWRLPFVINSKTDTCFSIS